jgi:chromosome segregation ATPase
LEIDRRYGLRERVSSSLALTPAEAETEAGRALLEDASRRVSEIDVREQFHVRAPWTIALPLVPALVFLLVTLRPNAAPDNKAQARTTQRAAAIKKETDKLREELKKKKEALEQAGLADAEELLKKLEQAIDDLQSKSDVDRRDAMIKMNDMSQMIEEKRKQLAGSEEIRKQMENLKDLQQGPGDKIAQALKQGDFQAAANEIERLREKIQSGELSEGEKKQLAAQLAEMQKKLNEMQQAYENAKRDLEEQIRQKQRMGDQQAVNDLQKKLNELNQMSAQMDRMERMSEALGQSAQAMENGDAAQASSALDQLSKDLQQMQTELSELETLSEMLDDIAMARDGLSEEAGEGMVSEGMQGMEGMQIGYQPGYGLGQGQGRGDRPEEATDTQTYESRVGAKVQKGRAVLAGSADGPNVAGVSREQARELVLQSMQEQSDPLSDDQLPRDQLNHTREYFKRYVPGFKD